MHTLDWILVGASLLTVLVIGVYTQQYDGALFVDLVLRFCQAMVA
jgi:hypothetical protein